MHRHVARAAGAWLILLAPAAAALDITAGAAPARSCPGGTRDATLAVAAVAWLEPAPVASYDDHGGSRYAPSSGRNSGVGAAFAELSMSAAGFCVGILYREQYYGKASRDLLDLWVSNHQAERFEAGRRYDIAGRVNTLRATGLRVRKTHRFDMASGITLQLAAGASLLKGLDVAQKSYSGVVTATSDSWIAGNASWQRTKSDVNPLKFSPYVGTGNPHGLGYSTDVELIAGFRGWTLDAATVDALGRIWWRDVPQSIKTLDNAAISYNANLDQDAAITGFDQRVDFRQDLPMRFRFMLTSAALGSWRLRVEDGLIHGLHFPAVGTVLQLGTGSLEVDYDLRTRAVGLGGTFGPLRLAILADDPRVKRASTLGISLSAGLAW